MAAIEAMATPRRLLPESLARLSRVPGLDAERRHVLGHVRAFSHLHVLGLVEQCVVPHLLEHALPSLGHDLGRARVLLELASEEARHAQTFRRLAAEIERGLGVRCGAVGPAARVVERVLARDRLAVGLLVLHCEWMTQTHHLAVEFEDEPLDPRLVAALADHARDEARHARLGQARIEAMVADLHAAHAEEPDAIDARDRPHPERSAALTHAIDGYLELVGGFDRLLRRQTELDLRTLERATGIAIEAGDRARAVDVLHQASRWTFLGAGMTHPRFLATIDLVSTSDRIEVETIATAYR